MGQPPQQLSPLPGAEKEAQDIAQLLNVTPLIGSQATKAAVVQQMLSSRIIHLATHGSFDPNRGIGSWLALTPTNSDDGFLTAEEIFELELNAELVVLSACDTGRGRITGDGVIGLSRSFISAGVPSVLVSLWKVDDAATAYLMREFYENWLDGSDKAQALRQAMLTTMQQYPAPENWAAFTLIGEAE
jgi:CHAT domain-containing protein